MSVSYFEGLEGIKEMYSILMRQMKQKPEEDRTYVGFFAHQKDTSEFLRKYWEELNDKLRELRIKRKVITTFFLQTTWLTT